MNDNSAWSSILRFTGESRNSTEEAVAREFPLTIILNNRELQTLLCSPLDTKYLAVGFLLSKGLLDSRDEITGITVDDREGVVRVDTGEDKDPVSEPRLKQLITPEGSGGAVCCGAAGAQLPAKVECEPRVTVSNIFDLVRQFQHRSGLYLATHGVHSAALCDEDILVFAEDIGRHNAIDRVFGKCLLENIPMAERMVVTSCRVSSEILLKVARRVIPIIVSIAAPTDIAIKLADSLGVTIIGSVGEDSMNVFTHHRRVADHGEK